MTPKKTKVVLLKGCVAGGENCDAFDEVTLDTSDANYLIACGTAADAKTDEGKEAIAQAKELAPKPKAKRKRSSSKSVTTEETEGGETDD